LYSSTRRIGAAIVSQGVNAFSRFSITADRGPPSPSIAASANPIDSFFRTAMIASKISPSRAKF